MCVCLCVCVLELQPASPPCGSSIKGGSGQPRYWHRSASTFPLFHSHNTAPGNAATVIRVIRRFETHFFMLHSRGRVDGRWRTPYGRCSRSSQKQWQWRMQNIPYKYIKYLMLLFRLPVFAHCMRKLRNIWLSAVANILCQPHYPALISWNAISCFPESIVVQV